MSLPLLKWPVFSLLVAAFLSLTETASFACVGCREPGSDTLTHEPQTVLAGLAFSWSVLFMLAFVLCLAGGLSFFICRTCRRLDREESRK